MGYDDSNKRPRTGSEHGQTPTFSQQQPLESPQYRGMYSDPQQSGFSGFSPPGGQAGSYSYTYSSQSPNTSLAARDQYFANKLNTQTGTTSPFDQSQRSPQYQTFPPQPQAIHFQASPRQQYGGMMAPSPAPPRLDSTLGSMENLGLRGPISPIGPPPSLQMAPPATTYGRMPTNIPYLPSSGRRDSYQGGFQTPNPNANLSAGSIAGMPGMYATRSPAVTTSGSGGLEGGY